MLGLGRFKVTDLKKLSKRIWGKPARFYFIIGVTRPERSESLQGVASERSERRVFEFPNEVKLKLRGDFFI